MLSAETKKGLFRRGGVVVEFFINKRSIGKSLSGGDGVAYKAFTSQRTGLMKVTVKTADERAEALLLCLERGQEIILIDIETIKEGPFSSIPRKDSKEVIKRLNRRYPVVYLRSGFISRKEASQWLEKNGFPTAPLLDFQEGLFSELKELGLLIRAIIGSAEVSEIAVLYKVKVLSFDDIDNTIAVDSWKDIEKKI